MRGPFVVSLACFALVACEGEASPPETKAPVVAQAVTPVKDAPAKAAPRAPNSALVGIWVEDRAQCGATDSYMALDGNGTAHFYQQEGRWSATPDTLRLEMTALAASEINDAVEAWSESAALQIIARDEISLDFPEGPPTRFYRCAD